MAHRDFARLDVEPDRMYDVVIDADLEPGALTWGEAVLPGSTEREVLVWTHVCHPSLANDGVSGIVVAAEWARRLAARERRLTWRFVFAPATIGALAWLWENRGRVDRIEHGLVLACLGDKGPFTWKRSRRGGAVVDRAVERALVETDRPYAIRPFEPIGYDERQFGSPGFDLPVGRLTRTPHGEYPEYHSSADDLSYLDAGALAGSLELLEAVAGILEGNRRYRNLRPMGEPRLSRWGLHEAFGRAPDRAEAQKAALWTLNLSDGENDLLGIAERSGLPFAAVRAAADRLETAGLLDPIDPTPPDRKEDR
jgi:aminopeptidase-like protein